MLFPLALVDAFRDPAMVHGMLIGRNAQAGEVCLNGSTAHARR
jgi:hypothetical protein